MWLVIPAAVALFLVRTLFIARRLKVAASNPTLADTRAFRDAKRSLRTHRRELDRAVANRREHLESAKRLGRTSARGTDSRLDRMVDDAFSQRGT